jgi:5-formyltetrahydrofolate cyclo-ligase
LLIVKIRPAPDRAYLYVLCKIEPFEMEPTPANNPRATLRQQLLAQRTAWASTEAAAQAQQALEARVLSILSQLEPECLGIFWPMRAEFNPLVVAQRIQQDTSCRLALPWAGKAPVRMEFRTWDGQPPDAKDDCGIPSSSGKPCEPDVVLVPCVGFTPAGLRLGYGGGYFDRYLAAHAQATALGVAWDEGLLTETQLVAQSHDIPLVAVLTPTKAWSV